MNIISELAGIVSRIAVSPDQNISQGQELLIIDAMKMEIPVDAPITGRVAEIFVAQGDAVSEGQLLARLQA